VYPAVRRTLFDIVIMTRRDTRAAGPGPWLRLWVWALAVFVIPRRCGDLDEWSSGEHV